MCVCACVSVYVCLSTIMVVERRMMAPLSFFVPTRDGGVERAGQRARFLETREEIRG